MAGKKKTSESTPLFADDWIPLAADLVDRREVLAVAVMTGRCKYQVVGILGTLWGWASNETDTPFLKETTIQNLVIRFNIDEAFWLALEAVGWLKFVSAEESPDGKAGIIIPRSESWISKGAKSRLSARKRAKQSRAKRSNANQNGDDSETDDTPKGNGNGDLTGARFAHVSRTVCAPIIRGQNQTESKNLYDQSDQGKTPVPEQPPEVEPPAAVASKPDRSDRKKVTDEDPEPRYLSPESVQRLKSYVADDHAWSERTGYLCKLLKLRHGDAAYVWKIAWLELAGAVSRAQVLDAFNGPRMVDTDIRNKIGYVRRSLQEAIGKGTHDRLLGYVPRGHPKEPPVQNIPPPSMATRKREGGLEAVGGVLESLVIGGGG